MIMEQAPVLSNGSKATSTTDSIRASPVLSTPAVGTKRKRANEQKFYAVQVGRVPGIYNTWADCLSQVTGHKGGTCKTIAP